MNGHCEFHIFEQAVDVCGLCFGDLCRSCALTLSGRRDTICKECALTISGVRGSVRIEIRGDRRTRKQRKAAYAAAAPKDVYFRFFDDGLNQLDAVPAPATVVEDRKELDISGEAEKPKSGRSKVGPPRARAKADAEVGDEVSREEVPADQDRRKDSESGGLRRIFGRRKTDDPGDSSDEDFISIASILGSEADEPDGVQPKDADAVSQLADIRRQSPDFAPPRARQSDTPDQLNPNQPLQDPDDQDGSQANERGEADEAQNPFLRRGHEQSSEVLHADLGTDPFAQPAQDEIAPPEQASPVGADDEIGWQESAIPVGADGAESGSAVLPPADDDAVEWTPADDTSDLDDTSSEDRADVDNRGLWIPPILRGIADDAAEAAGELPRRRRR